MTNKAVNHNFDVRNVIHCLTESKYFYSKLFGESSTTVVAISNAIETIEEMVKDKIVYTKELRRLEHEVATLRLYGNKDCTAMADEALNVDEDPSLPSKEEYDKSRRWI